MQRHGFGMQEVRLSNPLAAKTFLVESGMLTAIQLDLLWIPMGKKPREHGALHFLEVHCYGQCTEKMLCSRTPQTTAEAHGYAVVFHPSYRIE